MIPLSLQPSDLSDQVAGAAEMSGSWESALSHAHHHCCVWPFIAIAIEQWLSFLENKHIYKVSMLTRFIYMLATKLALKES